MVPTERQTLAEILKPYRPQAIADATGAHRSNVNVWKTGKGVPGVAHLPALANFLRMELGELTRIVARSSVLPGRVPRDRSAGAA